MRVLIIGDKHRSAEVAYSALDVGGFRNDVTRIRDCSTACQRIAAGDHFDAALIDARAPGDDVLDGIADLCAAAPDLAVVVMTTDPDPDIVLRTLRAGAQEILLERDSTRHVVQRVLRRALERHRCQAKLRDAVLRDELTGLLNRRGIMKALALAMRSEVNGALQACTLLTLGLNDLTSVDDPFDAHAPDDLLIGCGHRIAENVRPCDHVGRTVGGEFSVVLPRVRRRDAILAVVQNITDAFAQPVEGSGRKVRIGTSIGISTCPVDENTHHLLVKCSDQALREARRRGQNHHVFYRDIVREAAQRYSRLSPEAPGRPILSSAIST